MNRRVGFIAVGAGLVGAYILPEAPRGYLRALFGGSGDGYPTAQIPGEGSGNVLRVDDDDSTRESKDSLDIIRGISVAQNDQAIDRHLLTLYNRDRHVFDIFFSLPVSVTGYDVKDINSRLQHPAKTLGLLFASGVYPLSEFLQSRDKKMLELFKSRSEADRIKNKLGVLCELYMQRELGRLNRKEELSRDIERMQEALKDIETVPEDQRDAEKIGELKLSNSILSRLLVTGLPDDVSIPEYVRAEGTNFGLSPYETGLFSKFLGVSEAFVKQADKNRGDVFNPESELPKLEDGDREFYQNTRVIWTGARKIGGGMDHVNRHGRLDAMIKGQN